MTRSWPELVPGLLKRPQLPPLRASARGSQLISSVTFCGRRRDRAEQVEACQEQAFVFIELSASYSHSLLQSQVPPAQVGSASSKEASRVPDPFPIVYELTQCWICIGNDSMTSKERTATLCRPLIKTVDHVDRHLRRGLAEPHLIFSYILFKHLINHHINLL